MIKALHGHGPQSIMPTCVTVAVNVTTDAEILAPPTCGAACLRQNSCWSSAVRVRCRKRVLKRGVRIQVSPSTKPAMGHPKGSLGAPGPHLSGPVLPCIRPGRGRPSLGAPGRACPAAGQKRAKMAPNLNQRWGWPRGKSEGPWEPRGSWDEPN